MSLQQTALTASVVAELAWIWFLSRMGPHVPPQTYGERAFEGALPTSKRLFRGVDPHVIFQFTGHPAFEVAEMTGERFFPRVDHHMLPQAVRPSGFKTTHVTSVRLVLGMCQHMHFQVSTKQKSKIANIASKSPVVRVGYYMFLQRIRSTAFVSALLALIWLLPSVDLHMSFQLIYPNI